MDPPIAVTGMGLTTSLGIGCAVNWERLCEGQSGIGPLRSIDVGDYPVKDGGEDPRPAPGEPDAEVAPELRHLLAVCREALGDGERTAGPEVAPERLGLAIGSSLAASGSSERFFRSLRESGPAGADYGVLRGYYVDEQLGFLSARLGVRGPAVLVSNACAAGASAIARAADWLRAGRSDAVIAAGFDAFSIFTFAGFGSLMALSRERTRPFSPRRDGMKLGGGYAALLLEPLERIRGGDRKPIALLAGHGESSDAHHLTRPHPEGRGAELAMRRALEMAGLSPQVIDAINCHATATPANDAAEVKALARLFGERLSSIPLSATKPAVGHTLGGAGAVEAVVSILCVAHRFLPPNLNVLEIDPALGQLNVPRHGVSVSLRHVMSNSFGFGGSNASLIFSAAGDGGGDRNGDGERSGGPHGG